MKSIYHSRGVPTRDGSLSGVGIGKTIMSLTIILPNDQPLPEDGRYLNGSRVESYVSNLSRTIRKDHALVLPIPNLAPEANPNAALMSLTPVNRGENAWKVVLFDKNPNSAGILAWLTNSTDPNTSEKVYLQAYPSGQHTPIFLGERFILGYIDSAESNFVVWQLTKDNSCESTARLTCGQCTIKLVLE